MVRTGVGHHGHRVTPAPLTSPWLAVGQSADRADHFIMRLTSRLVMLLMP
ncbi:BQ5605_C003g02312 [Microbotryum silenes-dioicae]|uniref:BQ5605_C003g02312 protein n=1 Tax=Microbotryum silenes-dioicae TaxID=796604 RepID=A0A2X0M5L0_9BASI|nr:BQ5605_C003g02312 [Microbotryum silenes-dioicae]